jgi:hypothetical protein
MLVVYSYPLARLGSPPLLTTVFGGRDGHPTLLATARGAGDAFLEFYRGYKDVFDTS